MIRLFKMLTFILIIIASQNVQSSNIAKEKIIILAASSLTNVLPKVAAAWSEHSHTDVIFSFEATSRLAQQVKAGVTADLFFSADQEWMENLDRAGLIEKKLRTTLLSNKLVLIVPIDSTFAPKSAEELVNSNIKHLALAAETVPAGKFARAALTSIGILEKIQTKIVNANNARAALQWVALKEAQAGIVFQTDVMVQPKVKSVYVFPASTHPKIEYPMALIKNSKNKTLSKSFLEFCKSKNAKAIFEAQGFKVLL